MNDVINLKLANRIIEKANMECRQLTQEERGAISELLRYKPKEK